MRRPLDDVRIVALEQYGAGPFATMHLAELGAEIIKIEQWPEGDIGRYIPPFQHEDDSLFFQSLNRSKRSICLNLSSAEGRQVFEDLVRCSDGVFSNLRGDVPGRLRITYSALADINPAIVCCSLSGYGMSGPRAAQPGFDYMVQGLAGWMSITGEPEGPPSKTGLSAVDFASGFAAALALMAGIHAARRNGLGCDCDVSLLETAMSMMNYLATWTGTRDFEVPRVASSGHPSLVPFQNFRTADGWIVAGGSKEKFWQRMASALGREDLLVDERFQSFELRREHKEVLLAELDKTYRQRTTEEWLVILEEAQVPCASVNSIAEALDEPQLKARESVFSLETAHWGPVIHVGSPLRVGDAPHVREPAPALGQDTHHVLAEVLHYDQAHITALAEKGVIPA
jgi:crotonobetainyl-CoA:carnitine CoA-transferase CaiB-like acyl-CoA transferase